MEQQEAREMITETELRFVKARGKLYPDVKETLARLLDHGHFLTLCMNAGEAYTEAVLNTCGIVRTYSTRSTFAGQAKISRRRCPPSQQIAPAILGLVVIGDRYHDLLAGRRAGSTVIAASYGCARPGEPS